MKIALSLVAALILGQSAFSQTTIDDRTKRVALQAPSGWIYSTDSSPRELLFDGPRVSGVTSQLAVFQLGGAGQLSESVPELVERMEFEEPGKATEWNIGSVAQLFDQSLTIDHAVGRKQARTAFAAYRHGPGLLVMAFTSSAPRWDSVEEDVLTSLQSVVPERWEPVYADAKLGLWMYDVPAYATLIEGRTRAGASITWQVLTDEGHTRAEITVRTEEGMTPERFATWLDEREASWPADGRVLEVTRHDVVVSGQPAARFEVLIDYGSARNIALETCVLTNSKIIRVQCQCLDVEYADGFQPHFEALHDALAVAAP